MRSAICWCLLALWTLGFIILLSQEQLEGSVVVEADSLSKSILLEVEQVALPVLF